MIALLPRLPCPEPGCNAKSHHLCNIRHLKDKHSSDDCKGGSVNVRCIQHCHLCDTSGGFGS